MKRIWTVVTATVCMLTAGRAQAQEGNETLAAARAALTECLSFAEGPAETKESKESKAAFERAQKAYRAAVSAAPQNADAHAGLGETLSRCGIPHASMTTIMNVVEESSASLQAALKIDPRHWQARFILALNNYNMPSFLNRLPVAIRELETLQQQQGGRNDRPYYALTYRYLGDAYKKAGRAADAQIVYAAGAKLFPQDEELQQRARDAGVPETTAATLAPAPAGSQVVALEPLRVEGAQHQLEDARSGASLRRLDIYTMPGGTGEMLQTLQTLPGVTRAGDGADLYVRGGDPEETPVFINGGRLAFPARWEGLSGSSMGLLDATVLSKAYFSAGGFSAKYGNALSGVVDVETRGRPTEPRWRVGVNTVSAGASIFRPIGSRAGVWGTAMLTDVTLLTRMQGTSDIYPDVPRSYQMFAGGSVDVTPSLELKAVGVAVGDESSRVIDTGGFTGPFESSGQTQHGALSARWLRPDSRIGITANLSASRRAGGFNFGLLERDRTDEAYGARVDADVVDVAGVRLRGGFELTRFEATTSGQVPLTRDLNPGSPARLIDNETSSASHVAGYIEAERTLAGSLVGVAGVRVERLPGETDVTLDPRAALAYTSGAWTMRAGAGVFHQGRWRRTYRLPDDGAPTGVPTRARHATIGAERAGEPSVRVEAHAKLYDGYAVGNEGGPAIADGMTQGVDAIVRWQRQSRLNGWITYSLLDSDLTLADGDEVSSRFDVTHTLTGVGRFAVTDRWELGSTVRYATGKPYTPVLGATPAEEEGWPLEPVYGQTHGDRLPEYFRVDGRITRYQPIAGRTAVFYLEMLNLNGRRNVMGYQYDVTYTERKPVESFFARRTFVLGAELNF